MILNLSRTAIQDIKIVESDTFYFPFQYQIQSGSSWYGVSLSEFTFARMQIRDDENSSAALIEFTSTGSTNTIDLTGKATGYLIIEGDISSLSANEYRYDLEVSNSGFTQTIAAGRLIITDEISI
jgi:hypothetical protein